MAIASLAGRVKVRTASVPILFRTAMEGGNLRVVWILSVALNGITVNSMSTPVPRPGSAFLSGMPRTASSLSFDVFIENTDAQGVLFHGEYVKFVQRGLEHHFAGTPPTLLGIDDIKYLRAARLGDELRLDTRVHAVDEDLACVTFVHDFVLACDETLVARVTSRCGTAPRELEALQLVADVPTAQNPFVLWEDQLGPRGLSPTAIINSFERHRTTLLGGPRALARWQEEGIICVVGRIRAFEAANAVHVDQSWQEGPDLVIQSHVTVKGGRQAIFDQRLGVRRRRGIEVLSSALVTCVTVNEAGAAIRLPKAFVAELENVGPAAGAPDARQLAAARAPGQQ